MITHEPCASRENCYHVRAGHSSGNWSQERRQRKAEQSRKQGKLRAISDPEHFSKMGKIGGAKMSPKQIERSRKAIALLERVRVVDGKSIGQRMKENGWSYNFGQRMKESGWASKAGKLQGKKNVESGLIFRIMKTDTKPELKVKAILDATGIDYEHPWTLNGKFRVDFYVPGQKMIIEVDGCYWHGCETCGYEGVSAGHTRARDAYIKACGYNLIIIKEHAVDAWRWKPF